MESCPFKRVVQFQDSILMISQPLSDIISNMHLSVKKANVPLDVAFPTCKAFADSKGFSETQFETMIQGKLKMPHELSTSFQVLENTIEPPPIESFFSKLNNSHIEEKDYLYFQKMWKDLGVKNLLEMYLIYNVLDTTIYGDSLVWFFERLYQVTQVKNEGPIITGGEKGGGSLRSLHSLIMYIYS